MRIIRTLIAVVTVSSAMFMVAAPAQAEERRCTGSIGSSTVDNVKVPAGKTCRLDGTTVKGTINVGRNARLFAVDVRVEGNVQGENARMVEVRRSRVGGSVQVVQGKKAFIKHVKVNGGILFDDQNGRVEAIRNTVGSDIQAFQNTGGVAIKNNNVDGNLQCKENRPAPTGGDNKVQGNKEDQCRSL